MSQKIQVILPDDQMEYLYGKINVLHEAENMSQAIRLIIRKEMNRDENE